MKLFSENALKIGSVLMIYTKNWNVPGINNYQTLHIKTL